MTRKSAWGNRCGVWAAAAAIICVVAAGSSTDAYASGASPYLPLNLSPEIERKVERVLILAGKPVMTRPIPIARIMLALPRARRLDPKLCREVERYLDRYFGDSGVTHASAEVAAAKHNTTTLPNERGERVDSPWDASADVFFRPYDNLLLTAGFAGYGGTDGRVTPDGSMVSLGDEYAQLDVGYRNHWFSPLTDSSMLISTEAPTMPSFTLSNQSPMGSFGFEYELFLARMSETNEILYKNQLNSGSPMLAGAHLGIEPVSGWSLAGNATWQYGGGGRPRSIGSFVRNLFNRTALSPTPDAGLTDSRFANRTISITSAYAFATPQPFETYVEYGARDTLHGNRLRFHNTSVSAGVHFPELFKHFDLTLEASEWQNFWYTDYVWLEGLTENDLVIGNWGADSRVFGDGVGAQTEMAQLGYTLQSGDELNVRLRTLQNQPYSATLGFPNIDYRRASMITLEYAQPANGYTRGLQLDIGRDVFGDNYGRIAAFLRFDGGKTDNSSHYADSNSDDDEKQDEDDSRFLGFERFVDLGVSGGRLQLDLGGFSDAQEAAALRTQTVVSPHVGLGVRHPVTTNQDLGVRLEFDDFRAAMLAVRILDYRYRIDQHLAVGAFVGFARYSAATPAQGYYEGVGMQWRNLFAHWDVSLEGRFFDHLQRDKELPTDAQNGDPVEWFNLFAPTLSISRRF